MIKINNNTVKNLAGSILHPPKPKSNIGKRTFKYAGTIYFNSLPNYVKSATSVNSFRKMLIEYFTL